MASITIGNSGSGASVTAVIQADETGGTVITGSTTGAATIPAGCIWAEIANAGAVVAGDLPNVATVGGANWHIGRKERWSAEWDVSAGQYVKLPEININGNGARVFYSYMF